MIVNRSLEIPGYEVLEGLSQNDWHALYRGRRREHASPVLLKVPLHDPPRPLDLDLLERECAILQGLSGPGILGAHALERGAGRWCLVLEDRGGMPLPTILAAHRPNLDLFFRIATQLATIVADVHRQDVVHQHINPRSVLVHEATGAVSLTDFSLASRASGEVHAPAPLHLLRGALAYLSPEQTGRMNRATDYRTDFYSLGVTFYELLTGAPPFQSNDPLELIHWHIARTPPSPADVDPAIPEPVSRIVMMLLAKMAEERYQSARGLREDLEACARQWAAQGCVAPLVLGQRDVADRFLVSQKLYGRDREVDELLRTFDRTSEGPSAMLLVTGYAGIGKTSLIRELYKPIARQRGYFVSGKFDQIVRSIPYGALTQACRELVQQLLSESDDRLASWRARLAGALGANGGVLAEMVPEIELVIGEQPPPSPVGPTEAQNRFQLVFERFVGVIAGPDHPVVVFLDDLQWADSATLSLLLPLLTTREVTGLFLIGAYRDNEVDASHPLMRTLGLLGSSGVRLQRIVLGPLLLPDVTLLLRDTLRGTLADVEPLADLVIRKTDGNPFFVLQFLKTLRQDGLLAFDYGQGRWTFRMEAIVGAAVTDNVIDLMSRKIQRLAPETRRALTLAACIGNPFDPSTLAVVSQRSPERAADDLRQAVDEGLVVPAGPATGGEASASMYAFLHDRVQQAAYALISDDRRQSVHLTVGRLLLERGSPTIGEERLFDVVHHLNLGSGLLTGGAERLNLARLNLDAGRKAKSSTAYQAALGYFNAGIDLLPEDCWEAEYDLLLSLHLEAAECEYLCGRFEAAERDFDRLLARARTRLDKARIYSLKILEYEHTSRYTAAIRAGREGLALFDLSFPDPSEERQAALDAELAAIHRLVGERSIDSLIDLPAMQDPEMRAVMQLLSTLHTSCFLSGDKLLTLLNTATMVRLSLAHGNVAESAYAYALHAAMLVGPIREDYRSAYEFGLLALRLNDRLYDPALRAKVLMMFAWSISLWRMPLEASFPYTREAFRLGHDTGLFVDAAWALFNEIWFALLTSQDLAAFEKTYAVNVDYSERIKMQHIADGKRVILQWGRALQGLTESPLSFTDATFDEAAYRRTYQGRRLFEMFYFVAKLAVLYAFEQYQAAATAARQAEAIIRTDFAGTIWDELRVFYHALTVAALTPSLATGDERREAEAQLCVLGARLSHWAENSPHNFQSQHLIVSAEIARVQGRDADVVALYEAAIGAAASHERLRECALANELCAKFWRGRGQLRVAAAFMAEARACYTRWKAGAKVEDLDRRYPDLLTRPGEGRPGPAGVEPVSPTGSTPSETDTSTLDLATIRKVASAIAGEIELEKLLAKLMRLAIENAGAEHGHLLLERGGQVCLLAEGSLDTLELTMHGAIPLTEALPLSTGIVNYVRRTSESVVLADARTDDRYGNDPYILRRRPRSILCTPVLSQGRLIGVFYLENNLAAGAFTPARIELMQIIGSEAAISLENARLYDDMKQEVAARRRAEDDLRVALVEVESLKNRLQAENVYLQEEIRREHDFVEMVGGSPALLAVLRTIERVAPTDSTVLVSGETGTGKELIARALHSRSARRERPLVKVNCSAISAGLVESELFGHVKGAFTGALERRTGRFELADGGTIFLDEVGELPLETQVKLLRVLQEQEFEPVGSNRTVRVNVRVIAATNRNLEEAVKAGRFRPDLFYRLNVVPVEVPPLRERLSDIPQLVTFFVSRFCKKLGKRILAVAPETMDRLVRYPWPGNIRELQNVIERGVILSPGAVLDLGPDALLPAPAVVGPPRSAAPAPETTRPAAPGLSSILEEVERTHIVAALRQADGVVEGPKGAAALLKLHPNTLRSRMEKLGIKRPGHEVR